METENVLGDEHADNERYRRCHDPPQEEGEPQLLQARDETVMAWRRRRRTHVFEDLRLEITSSLDIQLDTQLALVDRARDKADGDTFRRVPALPMAEGWEKGHAG